MTDPLNEQNKLEELLERSLSNATDKSVISGWWIIIPIYIIAMLFMKTVFLPETTLISNIDELADKEKYSSIFFFLLIPFVLLLLNLITIWRIYSLSGNKQRSRFLKSVWHNILIIIFSIIVLFIYIL
jgi:hypothetical protein